MNQALPDHAAEADHRALDIDKVGIKDLSYPIQVLDQNNAVQHTVAKVNLYVSLPHTFKGTHMSRFVEILNQRRGEMTIRNLPQVLADIPERLEARDAHIEASFPYFLAKKAPVSGVESLMEYACRFEASRHDEDVDFVLQVTVPVKSLCPCSKAVSDYGAHNQRSLVTVKLRSTEFVWIEDVVRAVEACASAPLFALLKREDEKYITELAYDNPKFVEDLVRDVVLAAQQLPGVTWLHVAAENQESIHNHSAYAEIDWSLGDAHRVQPAAPAPAPTVPVPFGAGLKQSRHARAYRQQELAGHLGVSPAHLSRVESGEKRLSSDALERLAALLGEDPTRVFLRAGVVPDALLASVMADPDGFRRWARRAGA